MNKETNSSLAYLDEEPEYINELNLKSVPKGTIKKFWFHLVTDGMGRPIHIPVIVARGEQSGDILGISAAVHGNELNGIQVIQRLFKEINPKELKGTIVGIPVMNSPSYLLKKRRFIDQVDLNHIMPGIENGNLSEVYAYRFVHQIVNHFDYLIDLHTASFGRINSYYIRADLKDPITRKMAMLQHGQIVVHKAASDGTLRGAADAMDVPSVTIEVGDPNTFQKGMIRSSLTGIHNFLIHQGMMEGVIDKPIIAPVVCKSSYWIYTDTGGILKIEPEATELVKKGQVIANLFDVFGKKMKSYLAPEDGIVIGKNVNPVAQTGSRILHLGIIKD
jgi:hypothetical protein